MNSEATSRICANGAGIPCIGLGAFGMRGLGLSDLLAQCDGHYYETWNLVGGEWVIASLELRRLLVDTE